MKIKSIKNMYKEAAFFSCLKYSFLFLAFFLVIIFGCQPCWAASWGWQNPQVSTGWKRKASSAYVSLFKDTDIVIFTESGYLATILQLNDYTRDQALLALSSRVGHQLVIGEMTGYPAHDYDHPDQTNPTLFIHSNEDPDSYPSSWISMYHGGNLSGGYIKTGTGNLYLYPNSSYRVNVQKVDMEIQSSYESNSEGQLLFIESDSVGTGTDTGVIFTPHYERRQFTLETTDNLGNQFVIGSNSNHDYDHGVQSNPTIFIHSDTDPDSDNTQWMSLYHDTTSGMIDTGTGLLTLVDDTLVGSNLEFYQFSHVEPDDPNSGAVDIYLDTNDQSLIKVLCGDTDGCTVQLDETDIASGTILYIYAESTSQTLTFNDVATVQKVNGASITLNADDCVSFIYSDNNEWLQLTPVSDN